MGTETVAAKRKAERVQTDDVKRISMVFAGDIMVHEEQLAAARAEMNGWDKEDLERVYKK